MMDQLVQLRENLAQLCDESRNDQTDNDLMGVLQSLLEASLQGEVPTGVDVDRLFCLLEKTIFKLTANGFFTEVRVLCFRREMELAACSGKLPRRLLIDCDVEPLPKGTQPIAEGGFGKVYKTKLNGNGKAIAVKTPKKLVKDGLKSIFREILLWNRLEHLHILSFLGVCTFRKKYPALVSHWMDKGTLSQNCECLPLDKKYILLSQVASALDYLHNYKPQVIHEDIRGDNILLSDADQALLSDFGISRINESAFVNMSTKLQYGNARWLAPELLFEQNGRYPKPRSEPEASDADEEYIKASVHTDMWSFGMTIMEVLTGKKPFAEFRHEAAAIMSIHNRRLPTRPFITDENGTTGPPPELWAGIEKCWHENPEERPSATEMAMLLTRASRGKSSVTVQLRQTVKPIEKQLTTEAYASSSIRG